MVHEHVITERPIPGFNNYTINTEGGVFNWKLNKNVRGTVRPDGSVRVALSQDGRLRKASVHVLVMEAFFGDYAPGVRIKHLNGDRSNNHVSNLTQEGQEVDYIDTEQLVYPRVRQILVHQTGDVFRSPRELTDAIDGDASTVYKVLRGERGSYRGLTFEYID